MDYQIIHLPKEQWKGHILPLGYTTSTYYDVAIGRSMDGFTVTFQKAAFDIPVTHLPEDYDFPDRLYADWYEGAHAWGVLDGGELVAAIETCPETWSNRLRVTELWVAERHRRKGIGHALMAIAKEQARRERRRAVMLETQSCNTTAIAFYLHEGFTLIGFDACCYANNDLDRKEVRMELGWFPRKKTKLSPEEILVRAERPDEWFETENMSKRAFWNKHHLGCDEHYLVHQLRSDPAYVPEISRVAEVDGKIVGCILYSKSYVQDGDKRTELLTFGPLCVDPDYQGRHVGEVLLRETMKLAAAAGYGAIIIFGEPDYYPRIGFKTCDHFGITTHEGKNFDAFMGIELIPGALTSVHGKFYEADVFTDLPPEEVDAFDRQFPHIPKQRFPDQWD